MPSLPTVTHTQDSAPLLALAERVAALTDYDAAVAKEIFRVVFPDRVPTPIVESGYGWREDVSGWWLATGEDARCTVKTIYPPKWLSSLDAAMTLVPEGHRFEVTTTGFKPGATVCGDLLFGLNEGAYAATPALALTAAALRARATLRNTDEGDE